MGKVVGIDLGTTNSVVSVIEGGKPVVIANAEGMRTTPSVVAFSKEGERLVGQMARRQAVLNPQNTFYGVKRFVGRKYAELTSESKKVPYTIRKDNEGNVKLRCPRLDKDFAPEEISAMILRKMADEASRYLGQPVTGAVITVPAYFNDAQRQATRDAGRIAGLEVKRILNEPTAAALAYGLDQQYNQTILVFDLGGGTFDVSILDVRNSVFEVKSTSGDTQLGGTNFDRKIVDWLADEFLEKEGIDLRRDRQALQRLTEAAEKAKIELSGLPAADINLPFITATAEGPKHIETNLTRSQFEGLCVDLVGRLRIPLKQAMTDANLSPSQIDEVVLVGGASRMPMVQELVRTLLNKEPSQNVNPDEAVAVGAAIQAGILTQEVQDIMLLDVTPLSLGLETIGGVMKKVIPRNTTIPVRRSDVFSTSANNQTVVEIHILQGEREMAADNKSLGRFKLMGIPPAPRGIPQVQVSFDIDANGILQVSALDKTTGRQQSITVQEASNLSEDEIQTMIREAEEFADTDRLQRDRIEKRNRAETLTFQAERALREVALDFGLQFARDRRRRIEGLIQELRDGLASGDERGIDMAQADLQDEIYELNREAYLYDADNEDGNLLSQIGGTLKRVFSDEDDYYRNEYGRSDYSNTWERQAQWDSPGWDYSRQNRSANQGNWDDWDDDWDRPAARREDRGYAGGYPSRGYPDQGSVDRGYPNRGRSDQDYADRGYGDQGYPNRGYGDQGYPDRGYGDRGYGEKGDNDRDYYADRGYGDQTYGDRDYTARGYGDKGYGDRGYADQGYADQGYADQGYSERDYGDRDYPDQGYADRDNLDQSYGDRDYADRGYTNQGYSDRAYSDRRYPDREASDWESSGRDYAARNYPDDRRDTSGYSRRNGATESDLSLDNDDPWATDERREPSPQRDGENLDRPARKVDRGYSGNAGYPPPQSRDARFRETGSRDDYGRDRYNREDWGDDDEVW
jgi:molecular chaperone DnaK